MKYIFVVSFLCITINIVAQELTFDKRFVQSEDKWVAFRPDSAGVCRFGFIYIDAQAGLTLEYWGSFTVNSNGNLVPKPRETKGSVKYRLEPNNVLVAHIPASKFNDLKIEAIPAWLSIYKEGENTIERLYKWGYMYNGWSECEKALEFLEKGLKLNSEYKGLRVELAFSYNCLERYLDAITVLEKVIKEFPSDAYAYKEYIFALAKNNDLDAAKENYKKSLEASNDKTYQAENAYNILQVYFLKKNINAFNEWLSYTEEVLSSHVQIKSIVDQMKREISK